MPQTMLSLAVLAALLAFAAAAAQNLAADKAALLAFANGVRHSPRLNWTQNSDPCTAWPGVACGPNNSRVVAVRLPGVGLVGPIPAHTIGQLTALRTLSLRLNALSGPLPADLSALNNLVVLNLAFNRLDGSVPASIANLAKLAVLDLENNSFSGPVPELGLPNLKSVNLSNNRLTGTVPKWLLRFPNSAYSNNELSPPPALPPAAMPASRADERLGKKFTKAAILGIAVGGILLLFVTVSVFMFLVCSRRDSDVFVSGKKGKGDDGSPMGKAARGKAGEDNRLVFFEGCCFAFDLEDLLTASAEVLGKGTFGTAYKAALEEGVTVVVKRLKEVGVGKREFEQQMEVVGRIKHENVVELRAYYYSKDEKLMVYDYFGQGSVCALLHGNRGDGRTPLDWETRLKIALGAARGIAFIHTANNGKLVHGNIKSSNVFLNSQQYGMVSDLGLTSLMNPMVPPLSRTAGYRAPEMVDTRKASQAADVYSFGVLVLELLTGKSPIQILGGGDEVIHLVRWVQSVVREEWTAEVFDLELMKYPNIEEDLVEVLQIALSCVAKNPDKRPKMAEVVTIIKGIGSLDSENQSSTESRPVVSPQTV